MIRKNVIVTTATALVAITTLAGCSTATTSDAKPSQSASSAPAAESHGSTPPPTGVCDHGQLTLVQEDLTDDSFTVDEPCASVAILTNGAHVAIDVDIEMLTIEGSDNTVTAKTIGKSLVTNSGNTIEHRGAAPEKVNPDDTSDYRSR